MLNADQTRYNLTFRRTEVSVAARYPRPLGFGGDIRRDTIFSIAIQAVFVGILIRSVFTLRLFCTSLRDCPLLSSIPLFAFPAFMGGYFLYRAFCIAFPQRKPRFVRWPRAAAVGGLLVQC
jgi:hypothetical protein